MALNWIEKSTLKRLLGEGKTVAESMAHIKRVRFMPVYVDNTEEQSIDNAADDSYFVNKEAVK